MHRVSSEVIDALRRGDVLACFSKCCICQFGECGQVDGPHTWMEVEDIEQAKLVVPSTPQAWAQFAAQYPCGCRCNRKTAVR